jgi:hypothetical protein
MQVTWLTIEVNQDYRKNGNLLMAVIDQKRGFVEWLEFQGCIVPRWQCKRFGNQYLYLEVEDEGSVYIHCMLFFYLRQMKVG